MSAGRPAEEGQPVVTASESADAKGGTSCGSTIAPTAPWGALREGVVLVALALALAVLIRSFLVQAFLVRMSISMEPTLDIDDRILVSKKLTTDIHRVKRRPGHRLQGPGRLVPAGARRLRALAAECSATA